MRTDGGESVSSKLDKQLRDGATRSHVKFIKVKRQSL